MAAVNGDAGSNDLYGTADADSIEGFAGNDTLTGHGGADTLRGGSGSDALAGGAGNDLLDGGADIDAVLYYRETGTQGVRVNLGTGLATDTSGNSDTLVSVEQVYGSVFGDTLTGAHATGDLLVGWTGADMLQGMGANDTLVGGEGADTLEGGAGTDQVAYFLETGTQGVQVNLQDGTAVDTFGTIDRLVSIEQVYGSNLADTLTGLVPDGDFLFGRGGADVISGLGGNDTLVGGEGADTLDGGTGADQVAYFLETGTQGVVVDLGAGTAVDTFGTQDLLISVEQVHGSDFADSITGSGAGDLLFGDAGNDVLRGLGGQDTLVGGAGADTLDGGADGDQVAYFLEAGTRGVVVDLRAGTATDTFGDTDMLTGVEYVHGSNQNDTILGTDSGDDRLFGRDGDDYIDGRDGNNLIYTGTGDDHIVVGTTATDARDTVVINGAGIKVITGTGALGTAYGHHIVFDLPEAVVVNLATGIARSANMTLDFTGALYFLEVGGTAYDDHIIGGNPAHDYLEWLSGNQGNDTLDGGGGTGNTVIYDDEVRYGSFNHITGMQEFGSRGVVVNLTTGVATDSFGFTDTLINIDSVRATKFVDVLVGNGLTNGFWGLQGADTINGGAGSDRVHYGEDYLTGGTAGVLVNLTLGYAIDGFGDRDTLISIEEVFGTEFHDTLLGDAADNRLFAYSGNDSLAGEAGRDTLNGGAGNDTLSGGAANDELWGEQGNDLLNGGEGSDIARYLDAASGIIADLATGQVQDGHGSVDTLVGIEGIYGSDHADTMTGAASADTFSGFGGDDVLNGAGGEDTLLGGAGNDSLSGGAGLDELWGGAGNDTLDGGDGLDLVRYRDALTAVTASLATGQAQDGMGGTDLLRNVENLDGSTFGDSLTGDGLGNRLFGFEGDDTLSGGAGNDTLVGGTGADSLSGGEGDDELWGDTGNDTLDGGSGADLVRYRTVGGSVRADLSAGTATDGQGGTDVLVNVEHVDGSDHADVLSGNAAGNRLFGYLGADVLSGQAGNDTLLGGAGDDSVLGGEGDDEIWGEAGNDTLDGGTGTDVARYRSSTGGVTVLLAAGTADDGMGGTDLLRGIENVHGSDQNDALIGDAAANALFGYDGADTLEGGTAADTLSGGLGGDTYVFFAGGGRDVINDLGGSGGAADVLILADYSAAHASVRQQGTAIILDFGATSDSVTIANAVDAAGPGAIESVEFADGTVWDLAMLLAMVGQVGQPAVNTPATAGEDVLFGTPGANALDGLAGHDVLHGLAGDDTLTGGAGNDTILSGDGNDQIFGGTGDDLIFLGAGHDTVEGGGDTDTAVFDTAFAALEGDFSVDEAGVATIGGNVLTGIELFSFADRDITAAELLALARNAVPVSTLPAVLRTNEGTIQLDLATWFTDADGDALSFQVTDLPAGITLTDSVLSGSLAATGVPHAIGVIVSDGTHEVRQTVDWLIENVNAAPAGGLAITGSAVIGQDLAVVSTVTDADGIDPAALAWVWLRNGVAIPGATGTGYTLTDADFGARISVQLTYTDGFGTAEAVTSPLTPAIEAPALFQTGDSGNDVLRGGFGDDTLFGLDGNDLLEGRDGSDELRGGEGTDTLIGGTGDDFLFGGDSTADLRDILYGGSGNDSMNGGYGNDELRGDVGNDTLFGDFGADLLIGGAGNDQVIGGALGDEIYGNDGTDFLNGGFGYDRLNGGAGADQFYHLGIADHGSDWVQDYSAADGDRLVAGIAGANVAQFQVNYAETARAGVAGVQEAFVIYRPTGQILWALIDGSAQTSINLVIGGQVYDLLA